MTKEHFITLVDAGDKDAAFAAVQAEITTAAKEASSESVRLRALAAKLIAQAEKLDAKGKNTPGK